MLRQVTSDQCIAVPTSGTVTKCFGTDAEPTSYAEAAARFGLTGVLQLARARCPAVSPPSRAQIQALISAAEDREEAEICFSASSPLDVAAFLARRYGCDVDREMGLARMVLVQHLVPVPLFVLARSAKSSTKWSTADVLETCGYVSAELEERRKIVACGTAGIVDELRRFIGNHERGTPPGDMSPRLRAVLCDQMQIDGIIWSDLPPRINVFTTVLEVASTDQQIAVDTKNEFAETLEWIRQSELSLDGQIRVWRDLSKAARKEFYACATRLARSGRLGLLDAMLCDSRFELRAAQRALVRHPRCAVKYEWQDRAAGALLSLYCQSTGLKAPPVTIPQGYPGGPAHEFVLNSFRLFKLPLRRISSGAYVRRLG